MSDQTTPHTRRGSFRAGAWIVVVSIVVGLVMGPLWELVANRPQVQALDGELRYVDLYSKSFIQADMIFGVFGIAVGIVIAFVAAKTWRDETNGVIYGCIVGGLIGSVVAWRLGVGIGGGFSFDEVSAAGLVEGTVIELPLQLAAKGVLVLWAIAAALVLTIRYAATSTRARRELIMLLPPEPSAPE